MRIGANFSASNYANRNHRCFGQIDDRGLKMNKSNFQDTLISIVLFMLGLAALASAIAALILVLMAFNQ